MKKLKDITKRIATLGLVAALMVNSFPATSFAAEIGDPDLAVVMEEEQQEGLIIQSLIELDSPTLIFKGRQEGSILVITSVKDQKDRKIVVAIEFNRQEGFTQVNSIRSVYGRDNLDYFIGENIENGNLLAANKEKADELLRSMGKSYPEENTFISFK